VGNAHLTDSTSCIFVMDRFGNPNSAIYLNKSFLQVPSGVYFEGDFTITVWINLKSYNSLTTIIDFGNGPSKNNIVLGMALINANLIIGEVYDSDKPSLIKSSSSINLNEWHHVALTLRANSLSIYINGILDNIETISYLPRSVKRNFNYIGKSNWGVSNADAFFSDIKLYRGALTSYEISKEYDESKPINPFTLQTITTSRKYSSGIMKTYLTHKLK